MQIQHRTSLPTAGDKRTIAGTAECHRPLLTTLALQLGISSEDAPAIVESAVVKGSSSFLSQKESYTLKAWLTKLLIRDCVFKLNTALFSEGKKSIGVYPTANGLRDHRVYSQLPITIRLVYLLCEAAGFDEYEAAQILNSSPARVRLALSKAMHLLKTAC